ncbi:MAG: serine/threonine-protein kinase [Planctomycetota bacterium]
MESSIVLSSTDPDLPSVLPVGLKRYTHLREMARGGSAVLQSGFDSIIGRTVAIKKLLPETRLDRAERRRLLREARVTAQLQHPNTVPVYEIGDDPVQGVYFVMKRISGENLFEILKRIARKDESATRAFPLVRRLDVVADACQALAYAHARGVIHRDVKPENIWVGNFGEVILLDWGVAKVWGSTDHNEAIRQSSVAVSSPVGEATQQDSDDTLRQYATLTGTGQRPGTPLYMSPEQVAGSRGIDERSDVFSAGVVLYEVMAIAEPFRGRTIDETFDNIRNKDLVAPSERSPQYNIPTAVDEIVLKALAKRPGDRYQTVRQMLEHIREVQSHLEPEP